MAIYTIQLKKTVKLDQSGRGEFVCKISREGVVVENPWGWEGKATDFLNAATVHCSDYEREVAAVTPYVDNAIFTIEV